MAMNADKNPPVVISETAARGGVTGHNVRYVLQFGLLSVVVAFAAIALYFGYDRVQEKLSGAASHGVSGALTTLGSIAAIVVLGAVVGGLLLWVWTLISGPSQDSSQRFMRARVVAQLMIIGVIMAVAYYSMA